jgi:hypothetical protein
MVVRLHTIVSETGFCKVIYEANIYLGGKSANSGFGQTDGAVWIRLYYQLSPEAVSKQTNMPEGHTVHRIARDHTETFASQKMIVASPQGRFETEAKKISGRHLIAAEALAST